MDRRDFLDPRHLARAAEPLLGAVEELRDLSKPELSSAPVHLRFARRAMATTFEIIVPFGTPGAHELAAAALDEIDRLEEQLTVYRDRSEVSRLNARAYRQPVRVEKDLFDLLALAQQIHTDTDRAFDITVGALVKAWGFYRRAGRVPAPQEREEVRQRLGGEYLHLDAQRQTVAFERAGLEINLGSIGKGYALDRAATVVRGRWSTRDLLLHGGHSSILAFGREAPGAAGWDIGLLDPERPERRRAVVHLRERALATSAATYQNLEYEGRKLGHILDPRTGWPAEQMLSATVTAPSAAVADALATAFFILGVEGARAYFASHPEIGAALIARTAPQTLLVLGHAVAEVDLLR
jgi:FAD:protein FMN transferase